MAPEPQQMTTAVTKEQYANAVAFHEATSKDEYLFTGVHYRGLAEFLRSSIKGHKPFDVGDHSFVVVQTYSADETVNITEYHDASSFQSSINRQSVESNACQLLFLRGFPSADWLNVLGATYRLDPEFMRRHLDFKQPFEYYDLPSLPSSSNNMFRLRLVTICKRDEIVGFGRVEKDRQEEIGDVTKHQKRLGLAGVIGESIVRRFANHDEMTFSLEQDVSCYVTRKNGRTVVIIWLDTGRNLECGPSGPWLSSKSTQGPVQNICQPIIQHRPKGALLQSLSPTDTLPKPRGTSEGHGRTFQTAYLLPMQYGSTMDKGAILKDPFYALSELFAMAAYSEQQFLNLVQTHIKTEMRAFEIESGRSMDNLRYHKNLLDEHIERISDTVLLLSRGGGSNWKSIEPQSEISKESLEILRNDFGELLSKAKFLTNLCVEGSNTIMQTASLAESRKGLSQAAVVGRLTLLAFIFLPLSFVTSLFGMNFREFGSGKLSIWVFVATLLPLLAISIGIAFPCIIPWYGSKMHHSEYRKAWTDSHP